MQRLSKYYVDFGGEGPLLHFIHANGFHPGVYRKFLMPLTQHYRVVALMLPPLTCEEQNTKPDVCWDRFARHAVEQCQQHGFKPEIAMGHSLGAVVSLLAANLDQDFCQRLILLDPVFFPKLQANMLRVTPNALKKRHPMIRKTLQRPDNWNTRQEAIEFHADKRAFRTWDTEVLADYADHGFIDVPHQGGVTLGYSKYWEAAVYGSVRSFWSDCKACKKHLTVLRGELTDILGEESWRLLHEIFPREQLITVADTGHLLPFEQPKKVAEIVHRCLTEQKRGINERD